MKKVKNRLCFEIESVKNLECVMSLLSSKISEGASLIGNL